MHIHCIVERRLRKNFFETKPIDSSKTRALADLLAMFLQAGVPDGAKALWGIDNPNASDITCDVPAVPKK